MSQKKELEIMTVFGRSIASAVLIAEQPDEEDDGRTFVIKIESSVGRIVEVLPGKIYHSWLSSSGRAYCTSNNGKVLTFHNGTWSKESVCQQEVGFERVWGFSGAIPDEDVVFVYSYESLFVHDKGGWKEVPFPETVGMINDLHGLSANEVYLTTDEGILCYNGETIEEFEGPEGDELMGIRVLSDQELLATGSALYLWSDDRGWKTLDCPLDPSIAIEEFDGDIYIGSLDGVMRYRGGEVESVADFGCNVLANLGDGLLASCDDVHLFDRSDWKRIELPKLARGEKPL